MPVRPRVENESKDSELDHSARYILQQGYLDTSAGETPERMFMRVARILSSAEIPFGGQESADYWKSRFYGVMSRLEFIPGSPVLLNAGRNSNQLSSCHCLPVSLEGKNSLSNIELARMVQLRGSGTAFNFTTIPALNRGKSGNGSVPVIDLLHTYSCEMGSVLQGGIRIGCNTGILSVHHPDIKDFIWAKKDHEVLNNFYLTVSLTDTFMNALSENTKYPLIDPVSAKAFEDISAEGVFEAIVDASWRNGDPGVIFHDNIIRWDTVRAPGEFEAVSGCGEQIMLGGESCFLGSINLNKMLLYKDRTATGIDWEKLANTVDSAVRMLDNAYEANSFVSTEIARVSKLSRKIGLGVMGLADIFYSLQIPYDSDRASDLTEEIISFIQTRARCYSEKLADEKGACPTLMGTTDIKRQRNATLTTIAPTGTISIIAGCSAGIEPVFRLVYQRKLANGKHLLEVNRILIRRALELGLDLPFILEELARGMSLKEIRSVPEHFKKVFVTAQDILPEWHLKIQHSAQKHIDNAVSKTVNLPHNATRQQIRQIYLEAYRLGLKGITVYRDMSRENQPLACMRDAQLLETWLKANNF